jgi:UDP-glucose 4-epimerase
MSPRCAACSTPPGFADGQPGHRPRHSVLELVRAYAAASGRESPTHDRPRRPGDVAACYADPALAAQLLGWRARHDLDRMCAGQLALATLNPNGFDA